MYKNNYIVICLVAKFCPTHWQPQGLYSPLGFSAQGIFQTGEYWSTRIQGYWSRLLFPSPGDLSRPGIELVSPVSPALVTDSLPLSHLGSPTLIELSLNFTFFFLVAETKRK